MVSSAGAVSQVWAACGAMPWSSLPRDLRDLRDLREGLMGGAQLDSRGKTWLRTFSLFPGTGFMQPWPQLPQLALNPQQL